MMTPSPLSLLSVGVPMLPPLNSKSPQPTSSARIKMMLGGLLALESFAADGTTVTISSNNSNNTASGSS